MNLRTTLSDDTIRRIVRDVSTIHYSSNLNVEALDAQRTNRKGQTTYRFKLGTHDSREHGSRRSWSGRHGRWACWHAFRDVFARILMEDPEAVIDTGMARYDGIRGYLDEYPATADRNVGSLAQPAYMNELCDCDSTHDAYPPYETSLLARA